MAQEILVSGVGDSHHADALEASLVRIRPRVIGVVSAFVSVEGVEQTITMLNHCGNPRCRLVAGTDNVITHPEALYIARDAGWRIRLGHGSTGIFHPKLVCRPVNSSNKLGTRSGAKVPLFSTLFVRAEALTHNPELRLISGTAH